MVPSSLVLMLKQLPGRKTLARFQGEPRFHCLSWTHFSSWTLALQVYGRHVAARWEGGRAGRIMGQLEQSGLLAACQ